MVKLRFSFKMDLADISTIDFAFAETYADLETDPFLEKSYPEEGTYSQRSIILTLSAEEAELLPEQFYALATVNFKNGETIKAHAFKNTAKEEALSAALALEDTEFNINFFIDEVAGGGGGVDAYINGVKLEGNKTAEQLDLVQASTNIKVWDPVYDQSGKISTDPEDYPGIKQEDIMFHLYNGKIYFQGTAPDEQIYWVGIDINNNAIFTSPIKVYEAQYNSNDELIVNKSAYPNIKIGDLFLDNTAIPFNLSRVADFNQYTPQPTLILELVSNGKHLIKGEPPAEIISGPYTFEYDVGDIVESNLGYFQCTHIDHIGTQPTVHKYTWQEVTFVPKPTTNDAGKILQVNSNGQPEWVNI